MREEVIQKVAATREPTLVEDIRPRWFLSAKSRNVHGTAVCAEVQDLLRQLKCPNQVLDQLPQFRGSLVDRQDLLESEE
jgi:hypothetical protein